MCRILTAQRLAPTDPAGAARFGALLETFVRLFLAPVDQLWHAEQS